LSSGGAIRGEKEKNGYVGLWKKGVVKGVAQREEVTPTSKRKKTRQGRSPYLVKGGVLRKRRVHSKSQRGPFEGLYLALKEEKGERSMLPGEEKKRANGVIKEIRGGGTPPNGGKGETGVATRPEGKREYSEGRDSRGKEQTETKLKFHRGRYPSGLHNLKKKRKRLKRGRGCLLETLLWGGRGSGEKSPGGRKKPRPRTKKASSRKGGGASRRKGSRTRVRYWGLKGTERRRRGEKIYSPGYCST